VTASITMLPEITARVGPPRAIAVPYRLGFPLGGPNDPALQRWIVRQLLTACHRADGPFVEPLDVSAITSSDA